MLIALVLTVLIECGLSLLFKSRQLTYSVLLCNLLTNPLLNLFLILFVAFLGRDYYFVVLLFLEIVVVGVEAIIITRTTDLKPPKALLLSLFFNAASFGAGLLLNAVLI